MADRAKRTGRRLKFEVPADIIAEATRENSAHCMIADALKRAIPHAQAVTVDLATIRYTDKKRRERFIYFTPPKAQEALLAYDAGEVPEPFIVQTNVVQIVPMNRGRKPRTAGSAETKKGKPGRPAGSKTAKTLVPNGRAPGEFIKEGGAPPPVAAHASGAVGPKLKTGRARKFGLRVMGTRGLAEASPLEDVEQAGTE